MLEVLDFLERLAPFTTPDLLLQDERPLMNARFQRAAFEEKNGTSPVTDAAATEAAPDQAFDALEALQRSLQPN